MNAKDCCFFLLFEGIDISKSDKESNRLENIERPGEFRQKFEEIPTVTRAVKTYGDYLVSDTISNKAFDSYLFGIFLNHATTDAAAVVY